MANFCFLIHFTKEIQMNSIIKQIERLVKENIGVEEAVVVYAALTRINPESIEKDFGTTFVEKLQELQKEHQEALKPR